MENQSKKDIKQKKAPLFFSAREVQCVIEVLENKPASEIAATLEIPENTLYFHVNSVKNKLNQFVRAMRKKTTL